MATNATTWFYNEPETGRPYLITERLTHTFWANRLSDIYLSCVQAQSPYRVTGIWNQTNIEMEWEVNKRFTLVADKESPELIHVCAEVLGFRPTVSFRRDDHKYVAEWYTQKEVGKARINQLQGNPAYHSIKTKYK